MKILQSDYIHKNEAITDSCDECSSLFELSELDQVYVVQTEDDEIFSFCNEYNCYHNFNT